MKYGGVIVDFRDGGQAVLCSECEKWLADLRNERPWGNVFCCDRIRFDRWHGWRTIAMMGSRPTS
jgi:hypothetical protein